MSLLLFYAAISIFFSFICSILEAVLLSITPTFIGIKEKEGKAFAADLKALKKDVDKPLIAILTVNTIAHTVGAILVGVQAKVAYAELYGNATKTILGIEVTEDIMVGVVSSIMTILILVASEIIPKTIGATYWKQLANITSKALKVLIFPLKWTGLLWLLQLTTKLIGAKGHHGSALSREDFHAMADIAEKDGVFHEDESKVIKNLINFKNILAKDIMTPSTVMQIASETTSMQDFYTQNKPLKHSRIPVYGNTQDEIQNYFLKDNLLEALINGDGEKPLKTIQRKLMVTTRNTPIPQLFELFIAQKEHIALVVDEYGSVSGLVSQEDIIETLLGLEIMDESDHVADLQQVAKKNWESRAKDMGVSDKNE